MLLSVCSICQQSALTQAAGCNQAMRWACCQLPYDSLIPCVRCNLVIFVTVRILVAVAPGPIWTPIPAQSFPEEMVWIQVLMLPAIIKQYTARCWPCSLLSDPVCHWAFSGMLHSGCTAAPACAHLDGTCCVPTDQRWVGEHRKSQAL